MKAPKFCLRLQLLLLVTESPNFHSDISQIIQVQKTQELSMSFTKTCPHWVSVLFCFLMCCVTVYWFLLEIYCPIFLFTHQTFYFCIMSARPLDGISNQDQSNSNADFESVLFSESQRFRKSYNFCDKSITILPTFLSIFTPSAWFSTP